MLRILILLTLIATRADAGAWPLPAGDGQLSFEIEGDRGDGTGTYGTLYVEYGLAGGRTAGLDLGIAETEADKAVAFLRWHPGAMENGTRLAYELGAGMVDETPALRPGVSLGWPLDYGARSGWFAVDARAILMAPEEVWSFGLAALEHRIELDLTLGGDTSRGNKWLVQLQTGAPSDAESYAKLAPSYAMQMGAGRHVLLGVTAGIVGVDDVKLSLGLWQKF